MMDVVDLIKKYDAEKSRRDGLWLGTWREVRRYCYPTFSDYMTEGGTRGKWLFDPTAVECRQRLAAGIYQWMAPPDRRWFELGPGNKDLAESDEVKDYFAYCTKEINVALSNSNWPLALIETLNDLAAGLDGIIYVESDGAKLNFVSFPVEFCCYTRDRYGRVDTVYVESEMTAKQIVDGGFDATIEHRQLAADPARSGDKFKILHCVTRRGQFDARMRDNRNMPFGDYWIDLRSKTLIREGGYREMPFAVCSFERSNNENYGRGPGLNMLPTIRMINRMYEAFILATEHNSDFGMLVPDGSLVGTVDKSPGGIITYKADPTGAKPEILRQLFNAQQVYQNILEERKKIEKGFFCDIFNPLGDADRSAFTATEAQIRESNSIVPFAPIAGALHKDLFEPVIERVYAILAEQGNLPDVPEILLEQGDYKIEFISKIALSIKNQEAKSWIGIEGVLANLAKANPDILDNLSLDDVTRDIADAMGANPKWLRATKERDAIREARQEEQQAVNAMQSVSALAPAAQNLGKAPEAGSPMAAIMNGSGI